MISVRFILLETYTISLQLTIVPRLQWGGTLLYALITVNAPFMRMVRMVCWKKRVGLITTHLPFFHFWQRKPHYTMGHFLTELGQVLPKPCNVHVYLNFMPSSCDVPKWVWVKIATLPLSPHSVEEYLSHNGIIASARSHCDRTRTAVAETLTCTYELEPWANTAALFLMKIEF